MAADEKEAPPTIEVVEKLMTTGHGCFSVYVLNDHQKQDEDKTLFPQNSAVNKDARLLKGFTRLKKVVTIGEDNYNKWARSSQPVLRDYVTDVIPLEQMESQCLGPLVPRGTGPVVPKGGTPRQKERTIISRSPNDGDNFEQDWKRLTQPNCVAHVSNVPKMPPIDLNSSSSSDSEKEDESASQLFTGTSKLNNCQNSDIESPQMPKKIQNVKTNVKRTNSLLTPSKFAAFRSQSSFDLDNKPSKQSIHLLPISSTTFKPRSKMIQLNWREAERTYQLGNRLTSSDFAIRSKEKTTVLPTKSLDISGLSCPN